jgi:carboxyl-terminal processing protease
MDNEPETKSSNKKIQIYAVVIVLILAAFGVGFSVGEGKVKVSGGKVEINKGNTPSTSADYSLLWDALDQLNSKFVDRPLDQQKLMYGAVSGMVAAAGDPYTTFFDPTQAKQFTEQLQGSFDGIGAEVGDKDGQIVIIAPLDGTPAQKGGLAAGDEILAVDGTSTSGQAVDDVVTEIRGKAGTTVKLTILHKGANTPIDITITRANIQIKSVNLDTKTDNGKKIAVIKISQFGDDTKGLLDQAIGTITSGNYQGIVLDLRNNPGGYLDTAVSTISNWIDSNQLAVKEISYGNNEKDYNTDGVPRLKGTKTVVLVNGGSASASEIVSGALQDYGVATLVGEKTFGKGSVQELVDLKDNTEVKITVAKWYTPKGRGINKTGLEPDIKIDLTAADAAASKDPQMDKALELLK